MSHFKAKNAPNSISAPQTPLGELTTLPRPPSWIEGAPTSKGKGGQERERTEGKRGRVKGKGKEEKKEGREGKGRGESGPPKNLVK